MTFELTGWLTLLGTRAWPTADEPVPTFPLHDQAHLYFAYTLRLWRPNLTPVQLEWIDFHLGTAVCNLRRYRSGSYLSHDEVLGIFYWSAYDDGEFAKFLMRVLRESGGFLPYPDRPYENVFRMVEIEPIGCAAIGEKPSPIGQLAYLGSMVAKAFSESGQYSGILRGWLSIGLMRQFPISGLGCLLFDWILRARGITLEKALGVYFSRFPSMAEAARGRSFLD